MKNFKKLIAILLVATISYPNLIVQGDNVGRSDISSEAQQEIQVDYAEGEGNDESDIEQEISNEVNHKNEESIEDGENNGQADGELEITNESKTSEESEVEVLQEEGQGNTINPKATAKIGMVYETVKMGDVVPQAYSINHDEGDLAPEVIEKRKAMMEYKLLVPMTEANYEIALAYEDGSYTYVDSADGMAEAVDIVEELRDNYDNKTIIPAVISNNGQVVYSTNSMGRIWQHRGGVPSSPVQEVTNVYTKENLTGAYTYVNSDYIDDVPIIQDGVKSAKVRINGYDGWVNKDVDSGNFEMTVVPMNQVINPSYYYVENNQLYHYIAKDMTKDKSQPYAGNSIRIGLAPGYLSQGIKYYSYDGIYFYQGNSIEEGLNKLVNDLRNNTTQNAVNSNNPHYNYYTYLPFRTRSNYTAAELDKFINDNTQSHSKLRGLGKVFIECQEKYGVNPILALGVAINESGWGISKIALEKNNIFGMKAYDSSPGTSAVPFDTPGDSVIAFTLHYISKGYADPADGRYYGGYLGNKAFGANVKYASDPFWGEKAAQHAFTIDLQLSGGNVNNLRDYNGYQLAKFNGAGEVRNSKGEVLYNIASSVVTTGKGGFKENIIALKFDEATASGTYQVFSERHTPVVNSNEYEGIYNWNDNGYVQASTLQFVNTPKTCFIPGYAKEDINKNGAVGNDDLSTTANVYNNVSGNSGYRDYMDINQDGIIDVYDLVNISKKLN